MLSVCSCCSIPSTIGVWQIFDVNSRAILRTLDSHKQPVHISKFSSLSPTQVLTCSDDTAAKVWDIPSQTSICTFFDHTDYVRTGQFSTCNPNLVLTGSYDSTVRLFDSRTGECEMTMGGSSSSSGPVEQVLMYPSGTAVVSSAGPIIRIWDIIAGGRCLRAISNHQKTVTALTFNSDASRLLTGGLDHMVKVYDVSTYNVLHTMRYPAPILCLAISVRIISFLPYFKTEFQLGSPMRLISLVEWRMVPCQCADGSRRAPKLKPA